MSNRQAERNLAIWQAYHTTDDTLVEIGKLFGVSGPRVHQIAKQYDRRFRAALWHPKKFASKFFYDGMTHIDLVITDKEPGADERNWIQISGRIHNIWTGEVIPVACCTGDTPYYFRLAKPGDKAVVRIAKPDVAPDTDIAPEHALPYNTPVEDLPLSVRVRMCLRNAGHKVLGDILNLRVEAAMRWTNFGDRSRDELFTFLDNLGDIEVPLERKLELTVRELNEAHRYIQNLLADVRLKSEQRTVAVQQLEEERAYGNKLKAILRKAIAGMTIDDVKALGIDVDLSVSRK
jgi:hypothetical protein